LTVPKLMELALQKQKVLSLSGDWIQKTPEQLEIAKLQAFIASTDSESTRFEFCWLLVLVGERSELFGRQMRTS